MTHCFILPLLYHLSSLVTIPSFSHSMASSCKGIKRVSADEPSNSVRLVDEKDWNWTMTDVINVAAGEDIKSKIISFAQDHEMIITDLGHGSVSSAKIKPLRSAESLIYEGEFPISGLRGIYGTDPPGPVTGSLLVKLVGADGQIIRGYVEDFLVAATAVRLLVYIYEYF